MDIYKIVGQGFITQLGARKGKHYLSGFKITIWDISFVKILSQGSTPQ